METYLLIALVFMYFLTVLFLPKYVQHRIWTTAYILAFIITSVAIGYIKIYAAETLMKVGELDWYYILYVFGSMSIILGIINLWMYKKNLYRLFTKQDTDINE